MQPLKIVLLVFTFSIAIFGQKTTVDFNGEWQLTGRVNIRLLRSYNLKLTIVQKETQVKVKYLITFNDGQREVSKTYFADQRGETNPDLFGAGTEKTMTKASRDKISIEQIQSGSYIDVRGKVIYVDQKFIDKWELSDDGNTLTITSYNYQLGRIYKGKNQRKQIFSRVK